MDLSWMLNRSVGMRVAGGLFALWGAMACLRCLDARNRRRLAVVAALLSSWMLVVIVRWKLADGLLKALLWYVYYVPLTLLPLLCLLCALRASGLDRRPWARAAVRALWCAAVALIALVLTNDLHEQVFRFLGTPRSDEGPYAYVWGHSLVVAWSVGCYAAFFLIFVIHARQRLKPLIAPAVGACLVGVVFSLAYGLQVPWVASMNYSLAYCLLVAGALELCLDLGFIASYRSFAAFFDALPFDLKIVGLDGVVFRGTRAAKPLAPDVREQLVFATASSGSADGSSGSDGDAPAPRRSRVSARGDSLVFTLSSHPGEAFHVWRLAGALALLTQDTRDLDDVTQALLRRQDELRRTNQMLEQRRRTAALLEELGAEYTLMDDVERSVSSSLKETSHLLDTLPEGGGDEAGQARRRQLSRARMLLAYCKRKSSLVLFEAADPELDRDRIGLIATELAGDLRAVGIDCAAVVRLSRPMPARDMSILYDCVYDVAFFAFGCARPVLMYVLGERGDGMVELRAQLASDDEDDLSRREECVALAERIAERDVVWSLAGGPGSLRLIVRVRGEGTPA